MKIALAVDGSVYTKRMLSYIAAHDELLSAANEFLALNVTPKIPPRPARFVGHDVLSRYYEEEREKVLRPVRAFAQMQGWNFRERHAVGHPAETLAAIMAEERPDLLVMGSRGHGAFKSALLGSVAARLLSHAKVPVLLIR